MAAHPRKSSHNSSHREERLRAGLAASPAQRQKLIERFKNQSFPMRGLNRRIQPVPLGRI